MGIKYFFEFLQHFPSILEGVPLPDAQNISQHLCAQGIVLLSQDNHGFHIVNLTVQRVLNEVELLGSPIVALVGLDEIVVMFFALLKEDVTSFEVVEFQVHPAKDATVLHNGFIVVPLPEEMSVNFSTIDFHFLG